MSVEFEEEKYAPVRSRTVQKRRSILMRLVIGLGLAKTEKGANKILIIVAVVAFLLTAFVLYSSVFKTNTKPVRLRDIPPEVRDQLPQEILDTLPKR